MIKRSIGAQIISRAALGSVFSLLLVESAFAGEGASSDYLQGTYGDFQAAVWGDAGVYLRNDLAYYDADVGAHARGGKVSAKLDQQMWLNNLQLVWLSDTTLWGARIGSAVLVPYFANIKASGDLSTAQGSASASGDEQGIGDIYVSPLMLNWVNGEHNFTFAPALYIPTGKYDEDEALNAGRNYWALDVSGSYTWFDADAGHEFSMTTGVMFNDRNSDTDYKTGTEFHLDALAAQYLSESFGLGIVGYYYKQLDSDDGPLQGPINASSIQAEGAGFGPAVIWNQAVGTRTLSVIGKAYFDTTSTDRFDGNLYMLSIAIDL